MDQELEKSIDLTYGRFRDDFEKQVNKAEEGIIANFAASSTDGGRLYSSIIDLHLDEIRELYKKRLEIEKQFMLEKYGCIPHSEIEGLKIRVNKIIEAGITNLENRRYPGGKTEPWMISRIKEEGLSLQIGAARDIEIEVGFDKLRLEKEKRERFSIDYIDSLMTIFGLRDKVNLLFKGKYGFKIFELEHEEVFPKIVETCQSETEFATKIAVLGNLLDWMDVKGMKSKIKTIATGDKSITLLEKLLKQDFPVSGEIVIRNLRIIHELRDKKFPIHKEGEEVIDIFRDLGEKYPPEDWDAVWKKVMNLYMDSLKNLIQMFQK
jgi:hypothetical protein